MITDVVSALQPEIERAVGWRSDNRVSKVQVLCPKTSDSDLDLTLIWTFA